MSSSVVVPYSSTLRARCPESVSSNHVLWHPFPRRSLCISESGVAIFPCPCSRIRRALIFDILFRPRIAAISP
eukprot:9270178-Pyramimonas_sp.AAC.1